VKLADIWREKSQTMTASRGKTVGEGERERKTKEGKRKAGKVDQKLTSAEGIRGYEGARMDRGTGRDWKKKGRQTLQVRHGATG